MSRLRWSPWFRLPAFVAVFALGYSASLFLPIISHWSNGALVRKILTEVAGGNVSSVSNHEFAYALACVIVSSATGLALAFLVMHVLMIRLNLGLATRFLAKTETKKQFKERFDEIRDRLSRDPLIGRAWDDFERACIRPREGSNTLVCTPFDRTGSWLR